MIRKNILRTLLLVLLVAVLVVPALTVGCGSSSTESDERTLFMCTASEPTDGLDPTTGWGRYGSPLFQSTLLTRDENMNLVNDLATSYTVSDDKLTWTVKIREDAKFTDGEPLTADDVEYTFNTAATSGGNIDLTGFKLAVATSEYEVELHLEKPLSTFVYRLVTLGIVPEHVHAADPQGYSRKPVGSGPYKLVQWDEGQQMIIQANTDYYGEQPQIKRVCMLFMTEDAAFAGAQAGEIDIVYVPQRLAKQSIGGMTRVDVSSLDNRGICFPCVPDTGQKDDEGNPIGNNVTSDLAIRQAINYVVDRQALVDGVLEGFGSVAYGPVSHLPWEETSAAIQDSNPAVARQILADGGWSDTNGDGIVEKNGLKAEFTLVYSSGDSTRQALAVAAAEMIKAIGIKINLDAGNWDYIETKMHSCAVLFGWGSHDQTEIYNLYHSSNAGVEYYNAGYYSNAAVDSYLDKAMAAKSEVEAISYWKAAQWDGKGAGFTARGDAAWAWLVNIDHVYFVSDKVDIGPRQVESHGHGFPFMWNVTSWAWMPE